MLMADDMVLEGQLAAEPFQTAQDRVGSRMDALAMAVGAAVAQLDTLQQKHVVGHALR